MYTCVKKYPEISVSHRNWRAKTHCSFIHGYARSVEFTFTCDELDENNYVIDFGGLRFIKNFLEEQWDHRTLIASDDPLLDDLKNLEKKGAIYLNIMDVDKGWGPGIELSCKYLADHISEYLLKTTNGRVRLKKVEIWEKEQNRAALELC